VKVRPHGFSIDTLVSSEKSQFVVDGCRLEFFTQFGLPGFPLCGGGSVELSSSEGEPALPSWLGTDDLMICKKQCVDVDLNIS